jgi:CRISPR-associated protein Csm5
MHRYPITISTLSPLHLGCDEDYEPTNYIVQEGKLYSFRTTALAAILTAEQRRKLTAIASGDNALLGVQKFIFELGEALLPITDHCVDVAPSCAAKYTQRIGQPATLSKDAEAKIINKLAIPRTAYNVISHQPVIPGSGLKGAIRTALLNYRHAQHPAQRQQAKKDQDGDIQQKLLGGRFADDAARLVKLSDAHFVAGAGVVDNKVVWACNIKKRPPANSQPKSDLAVMREVVHEMNAGCFSSELRIDTLPGITAGKHIPQQPFTIDTIVDACNTFYRPLLEAEVQLLNHQSNLDQRWYKALQVLLTQLEPMFNQRRAMLLRVGRHSGAEAVTIDGLRNITIPQKKDPRQKYGNTSATTLWLAGDNEKASTHLLPFGWLLVQLQPGRDAAQQAIVQGMHQYNAQAFDRQQHSAGELQERQLQQVEKLRKRQQQEARNKQQREAQQAAEEQEALRVASLSPREQAIESIQAMLAIPAAQNSGAGNQEYAGKVTQVINDAGSWPAADQAMLYQVARQALVYFGVDLKSKKWKARLNALRHDA